MERYLPSVDEELRQVLEMEGDAHVHLRSQLDEAAGRQVWTLNTNLLDIEVDFAARTARVWTVVDSEYEGVIALDELLAWADDH